MFVFCHCTGSSEEELSIFTYPPTIRSSVSSLSRCLLVSQLLQLLQLFPIYHPLSVHLSLSACCHSNIGLSLLASPQQHTSQSLLVKQTSAFFCLPPDESPRSTPTKQIMFCTGNPVPSAACSHPNNISL